MLIQIYVDFKELSMKLTSQKVLQLIAQQGKHCDDVLAHGQTCLHLACREGEVSIVESLLGTYHSKALTIKDHDGKCPLHEAVIYNNIDCVKVLLNYGSPVDPLKRADWTPLMHACENGNVEIFEVLLNNGARVDLLNKDGWSCLHLAARNGSLAIVKRVVELSSDLCRGLTTNGRTALHCAALHGRFEVCNFFLQSKLIDVEISDSCGTTAFLDAISTDSEDLIELFNSFSANINAIDSNGNNAVHLACQFDCASSLEKLVKLGLSLETACLSKSANTASHFTVSCNSFECLELLRQTRPELFNIVNAEGFTALDLVNTSQSLDILRQTFPSIELSKPKNKYKLNEFLKYQLF